jgi:CRP-like cAMP-binding protein
MSSNNEGFLFEESINRLVNLLSIPPEDKTESDIYTITNIVTKKAPKLFDLLSRQQIKKVAANLVLKCCAKDEVIFLQGEEPDAYYTTIRGKVSIYARASAYANHDVQEGHETRQAHGKFLVQLPPGAG